MEDVRAGKPVPKPTPVPESGVLSLKESTLCYASPVYGNWQVPLSEIIAFGEYTTDNGPHIDDWYLVFVTRDFNWVEASNYCAGADDVRTALAQHWGVDGLYGELAFSTDFSSRAIWPAEIAGKPLFDFVERTQSIWEKIKSFGMGLIDKDMNQQVRSHLKAPQTP